MGNSSSSTKRSATTAKILMFRFYLKSIKSEFQEVGSRHWYFLKSSSEILMFRQV